MTRARRRGRPAAVLAVSLLAMPQRAFAQALPIIEAGSACPDRAALAASLGGRALASEVGAYRLRTSPGSDGVTLALESPEGRTVLERSIESEDCAALADAVALIVETYFVELSSAHPSEQPAATAETVPSKTPASPGPALVPALPSSPPERDRGMLDGSDDDARRRVGLWLGLGAEVFPRDVSWVVEAGGGWRWPALGLLADLRVRTGTPTTAGSSPDDVSRWASRLTGRVGLASRGRPSFEGHVGSGLSVSRLELERAPEAPVRLAVSPVFEAGLGLEIGAGGAFGGRVEGSCALFVLQESYQLAPDGEVGQGPRYSCGILGGVAWGLTPGSTRTASTGRNVDFH